MILDHQPNRHVESDAEIVFDHGPGDRRISSSHATTPVIGPMVVPGPRHAPPALQSQLRRCVKPRGFVQQGLSELKPALVLEPSIVAVRYETLLV